MAEIIRLNQKTIKKFVTNYIYSKSKKNKGKERKTIAFLSRYNNVRVFNKEPDIKYMPYSEKSSVFLPAIRILTEILDTPELNSKVDTTFMSEKFKKSDGYKKFYKSYKVEEIRTSFRIVNAVSQSIMVCDAYDNVSNGDWVHSNFFNHILKSKYDINLSASSPTYNRELWARRFLIDLGVGDNAVMSPKPNSNRRISMSINYTEMLNRLVDILKYLNIDFKINFDIVKSKSLDDKYRLAFMTVLYDMLIQYRDEEAVKIRRYIKEKLNSNLSSVNIIKKAVKYLENKEGSLVNALVKVINRSKTDEELILRYTVSFYIFGIFVDGIKLNKDLVKLEYDNIVYKGVQKLVHKYNINCEILLKDSNVENLSSFRKKLVEIKNIAYDVIMEIKNRKYEHIPNLRGEKSKQKFVKYAGYFIKGQAYKLDGMEKFCEMHNINSNLLTKKFTVEDFVEIFRRLNEWRRFGLDNYNMVNMLYNSFAFTKKGRKKFFVSPFLACADDEWYVKNVASKFITKPKFDEELTEVFGYMFGVTVPKKEKIINYEINNMPENVRKYKEIVRNLNEIYDFFQFLLKLEDEMGLGFFVSEFGGMNANANDFIARFLEFLSGVSYSGDYVPAAYLKIDKVPFYKFMEGFTIPNSDKPTTDLIADYIRYKEGKNNKHKKPVYIRYYVDDKDIVEYIGIELKPYSVYDVPNKAADLIVERELGIILD